jgi:tetratricopeptide (TPR) repeat protein
LRASLLRDRATVWFDQGKEAEALSDLSLAARLQSIIVNQPGYDFMNDELADTLATRGQLLIGRRDYRAAFANADRAVALLTPRVQKENREDLISRLAAALRVRGEALAKQRRWDEAAKDLGAAREMLSRLRQADRTPELAKELVAVCATSAGLLVEAAARSRMHREELLVASTRLYEQAVSLSRRLISAYPRVHIEVPLAFALKGHSVALFRLGRQAEAANASQEAYMLFKEMSETSKRTEYRLECANCMINLGLINVERGMFDRGMAEINAGIEIIRELGMVEGGTFQGELAISLQLRGRALGNHDQKEKALKDFDESIRLFQLVIEREGPGEFTPHLARTIRHRRELLEGKPLRDLP